MSDKNSNGSGKPFNELTADYLMQTDPVHYHKDVDCRAIVAALVKNRSGAITIVDQKMKPIGIITEYDLLRAIQDGKDLAQTPSQQIMTEPIIISEKSLLTEILDTLVTGHLIHLPVVDYEEKLIGLIERQDILLAYLNNPSLPRFEG